MICDKLQAGIRQCLEVMSGIESNYFKNEYLNEGNHDQLMGCVMRELSERHTIRLCEGDNSLKMLTGCMQSSLKDHVIILFRWRVAAFVKKWRFASTNMKAAPTTARKMIRHRMETYFIPKGSKRKRPVTKLRSNENVYCMTAPKQSATLGTTWI
uniref:Uncharacterized protein n=1 Tax=Rhipicephalus microplus TaxID=6941 RepID=A0A6G5AGN5_RHIMP